MGSINTEEAARRLARVILSDIELYDRERPKQGESLEAQIEQARRLFASRVTPDLVAVFGLVLADHRLGRVNSPAATDLPSTHGSVVAAAAFGPDHAPPASDPTIHDRPAPSEDRPTPAPARAAPPVVDQPALTASVPPALLAPEVPTVVAQARPAAPPPHEITTPVRVASISIPRLLAVVPVVAAIVAVLYHFLR